MFVAGIVGASLAAAAGIYFGFVEDLKWAFAIGVLALAWAVLGAFGAQVVPRALRPAPGRPAPARPARERETPQGARPSAAAAIALVFLASAVGIYFGFVDDLKWAFAIGVLALAWAVLSTFRGRLA